MTKFVIFDIDDDDAHYGKYIYINPDHIISFVEDLTNTNLTWINTIDRESYCVKGTPDEIWKRIYVVTTGISIP